MNLTLLLADLPSHRLCAAAQAMCGAAVNAMVSAMVSAIVRAMAIASQAAFNHGAPPGALKNRRSSA